MFRTSTAVLFSAIALSGVLVAPTPAQAQSRECTTRGIDPGSDTRADRPDITAGQRVRLAFSSPTTTATITIRRTAPAPVAVVRELPPGHPPRTTELGPVENTTVEASSDADAPGCSPVIVPVTVRSALSIAARRLGPRDYLFSGRVFPARGQVVSLYRYSEQSDSRVLTAQGRVQTDGTYSIRRHFTGSGRFGFGTYVAGSERNAAGESLIRSTLVY